MAGDVQNKDVLKAVHLLFSFVYCTVTLYSMNYIYYKVLKKDLKFNKAEPTFEFNHPIIQCL